MSAGSACPHRRGGCGACGLGVTACAVAVAGGSATAWRRTSDRSRGLRSSTSATGGADRSACSGRGPAPGQAPARSFGHGESSGMPFEREHLRPRAVRRAAAGSSPRATSRLEPRAGRPARRAGRYAAASGRQRTAPAGPRSTSRGPRPTSRSRPRRGRARLASVGASPAAPRPTSPAASRTRRTAARQRDDELVPGGILHRPARGVTIARRRLRAAAGRVCGGDSPGPTSTRLCGSRRRRASNAPPMI